MSRRIRTHAPDSAERWIVDGIEDTPTGRVARLELPSGKTADLPLQDLPEGLQEGDILAVQEGPDGLVARILPAETAQRRASAQAKLDTLNAANPAQEGEEITL
ncbi:hypothetical protein Dxin01_04102 [Deinococcus xinjiangensis]|uniref:DUF3006 domain-containing protein n=1 Tax=Deinococcus xinjiangensis TaxID=457454 RepID=A0ABP9VGI6_9DEIO